jgi:hypothetical protein
MRVRAALLSFATFSILLFSSSGAPQSPQSPNQPAAPQDSPIIRSILTVTRRLNAWTASTRSEAEKADSDEARAKAAMRTAALRPLGQCGCYRQEGSADRGLKKRKFYGHGRIESSADRFFLRGISCARGSHTESTCRPQPRREAA